MRIDSRALRSVRFLSRLNQKSDSRIKRTGKSRVSESWIREIKLVSKQREPHRLDESLMPDLSYFFSRESQVRVWHAVEPESDFFPLRREGSSDNAEWRRASGFQGRVVLLPRADVQRATGEDPGEAASAGRVLRRSLARSAAARIH